MIVLQAFKISMRVMIFGCASLVVCLTDARAQTENFLFTKDLAALTAYRERPLFSPSRRPQDVPAPVDVAPQPIVTDALNAVLLGVISSDDGSGLAVLRIEGEADVKRVRIGEAVGGWQLDRIEQHAAIFKSGDQSVTLTFPSSNPGDMRGGNPEMSSPSGVIEDPTAPN